MLKNFSRELVSNLSFGKQASDDAHKQLAQAKKEVSTLKTDLEACRLAYNKTRLEVDVLTSRDEKQKQQISEQADLLLPTRAPGCSQHVLLVRHGCLLLTSPMHRACAVRLFVHCPASGWPPYLWTFPASGRLLCSGCQDTAPQVGGRFSYTAGQQHTADGRRVLAWLPIYP